MKIYFAHKEKVADGMFGEKRLCSSQGIFDCAGNSPLITKFGK